MKKGELALRNSRPQPAFTSVKEVGSPPSKAAALAPECTCAHCLSACEVRRSLEIRCPPDCGCGPRGKLLATLIDVPGVVFGSGAVLQLACPNRKSRLIKVVL